MCGFLGIEKSNMFQEIHLEKFVQQMQWYLKRKTIIKKKKKFESKLQREIQNFTCHTGETKKNLRLQEEFNPRPSDKTSYTLC